MTAAIASLSEVTVVLVTFNSAHCLPALATALGGFPNVIIFDNASGDGTVEQARAALPQAEVIAGERNFGFGAANNRALERVKTPYAFLLNPDCEVSADAMLQLLQIAHDNPGAAMIAPQLLRSGGAPEVNYRWPSPEWESAGPAAEGLCCVGFACGAALLLDMAVMRNVGFFDEGFFLYYEDDDLCTRIFDRRLPILLAPQVRLVHSSRGSVRGNSPLRAEYLRGYHHAQSKIRFVSKYPRAGDARTLRRKVLLLALLALPLRLLIPIPRHLGRLLGRIVGLLQAGRIVGR
ncbi:glycosyltransferase family 2 protein [Variovorax sp. VNK109]|jgi:N-acetylglucosaminyl-diphospho-decaprenol L-rhamnosyltransferase|uniref:glycosyltransferase family 2 protein n=1 Tax=Variovorax sp. VNK109 TaxID=3400919 RepID=UPI003C093DB9